MAQSILADQQDKRGGFFDFIGELFLPKAPSAHAIWCEENLSIGVLALECVPPRSEMKCRCSLPG
jgi:hypothetical protein